MKKKFWVSFIVTLALGTVVSLALRQKSAQASPTGYPIGGTVNDFKL